jgi:hypothetical protein
MVTKRITRRLIEGVSFLNYSTCIKSCLLLSSSRAGQWSRKIWLLKSPKSSYTTLLTLVGLYSTEWFGRSGTTVYCTQHKNTKERYIYLSGLTHYLIKSVSVYFY